MKVVDRELYLGVALSQIVENVGFRSMRKASPRLGHYEINGTRRILVRHTKSARGPWSFSFRPDDLRLIREELATSPLFFLGLVCGNASTCLLTADQLVQVIDLSTDDVQSIRVSARPGSSLSISGSAGSLDGKVTNHAFPSRLFL